MRYIDRKIVALCIYCSVLVFILPANAAAQAAIDTSSRDGSRDFDFEIGSWKTHLRRLSNPLSGQAPKWVEYEGRTVVREVWGGKANLVELAADGPAGHFEGLSLRLYNPQARQWALHFANARNGLTSAATLGRFRNGVGEFYNQDDFDGRMIFVRFIITPIGKDTIRFEQSFSEDGGKTWELNWIATDTRDGKR
jgi:hypothetical protein